MGGDVEEDPLIDKNQGPTAYEQSYLATLLLAIVAVLMVITLLNPEGKYAYLAAVNESLGQEGNAFLRAVRIDDGVQNVMILAGLLLSAVSLMALTKNKIIRGVALTIMLVLSVMFLLMRYNTIAYLGLAFWILSAAYLLFSAISFAAAWKLGSKHPSASIALSAVGVLFLAMMGGSVSVALSIKDPQTLSAAIGDVFP